VTAIFCGLIYLVIGLPLSLVIKDKPEDMELLPDGASTKLSEGTDSERKVQIPPEGTGDETKFSAGATLRSRTFWTLVLAESFRSFLLGSVVLHQIPYLVSIGVAQDTAANILGLMIAMSIPGRLFFGSLGDFYSKRKLLVIVMALQALGIFAFSQAQGVMHAYAFVAIYGVSYGGGIPLTYAFRGELFGRRRYAIISGLIAPFKMIGSVVGPIFAGYIYDVYQDYSLAFTVFTLLAVLSSMTFIFVKPDRLFARTLQG